MLFKPQLMGVLLTLIIKELISIVLMAVCDAHYRFILVDIGDAGHQSDGGVFANSDFGQAIENQTLHIPRSRPLPGTSAPDLPYVFKGKHALTIPRKELR